MKRFRSINPDYLTFFLMFAFAFLYLFLGEHTPNLSIYQGRDLSRALALLRGEFIWHGSELSGGGTTPGPFYYYLLAIPLSLFGEWRSALFFDIGLTAGAAALFWLLGRLYISSFAGAVLYFFFLNSRIVFQNMNAFWNPSFLPFFQAVLLILLYRLPDVRVPVLVLSGLILGLSLQLHYTQAVFLLAAILTIAVANEMSVRSRLRVLSIFCLSVIIPILPHIFWKVFSEHAFGRHYALSAGASTVMDPLRLIFRNDAGNIWERVAPQFELLFTRAIAYEFLALAAVVLLLMPGVGLIDKKSRVPRYPLYAFLFSAPLFLSVGLHISFMRYLTPFFILLYVVSVHFLDKAEERSRGILGAALSLSLLHLFCASFIFQSRPASLHDAFFSWFGLTLLVMAAGLIFLLRLGRRQNFVLAGLVLFSLLSVQVRQQFRPLDIGVAKSPQERAELVRSIVAATAWTYEEFRTRVYLIGFDPEDEVGILYDEAYAAREAKGTGEYDGVVVSHSRKAKFVISTNSENAVEWDKLRGFIPTQLMDAAKRGEIVCALIERSGVFDLCYYRFKHDIAAKTWNNLGSPYRKDGSTYPEIKDQRGFVAKSTRQATLYYNPCKGLDPNCGLYVDVEFGADKNAKISVWGRPVSVPSQASNPAWAVSLDRPQIQFDCGGKSETRVIADRLGYPPRRLKRKWPAPFFLAPYRTTVSMPCDNPSRVSVVASAGDSNFTGFTSKDLEPFQIDWAPQQTE
ncbi:MAG: hypothetical protein ABL958_16895 [Bdellovibrionia bacterium]